MADSEASDGAQNPAGSRESALSQELARAIAFHESGNLVQAEELYRRILQANPDHPLVLNLLGVVAHQVGNLDVAESLMGKAIALRPDFAEAHCNLGSVLHDAGRIEDAEARFRSAIGQRPELAEAHSNLGNALRALGQFEDAADSCRKAIALRPDLAEAHGNLGNALKEMNRHEEALDAYAQALAIDPDFVESLCNAAATLLTLGRADEAEKHAERALGLHPDLTDAHTILGNAKRALGNMEAAADCYRAALSRNAVSATAHSNLGATLKELGHLDEAADHCRSAIEIEPQFAEAHSNLGAILIALERFDEAIGPIRKAIELAPDIGDAHTNLGHALRHLGLLEEAAASYKNAIALGSATAETHGNLGVTHQELGDLGAAEERYREAIAIDPEFAAAQGNLGAVLNILGRTEEATACLRRAIELDPAFAEAHFNLGFSLNRLGNREQAAAAFRRAIALDGENDMYWAGLAGALDGLAIPAFDEALALDLRTLLAKPTVRVSQIVQPILQLLRHDPEFAPLLDWNDAESHGGGAVTDAVERLSSKPLFLELLALNTVHDLEVETMLTRLRRAALFGLEAGGDTNACPPFIAALALHCFANEYVFSETVDETAAVEKLAAELDGLAENGQELPLASLAAIAAYRPLNGFSWGADLAERTWPDGFDAVIERQIREPMAEQALRQDITQITAVQDTVSQAVRTQYEENPYPRWTKGVLQHKPMTIRAVLESNPLCMAPKHYVTPRKPQILVAGCGTGQQALYVASRYANADVLAVDLSLNSLSYAIRKSTEYGVTNIEYVQGDIMELGSLDRQFDLVDCMGVLHHLKYPLAGWRVLRNLLQPDGLMRIGLYSAAARRCVVEGRALIAERGYSTSPEDIRRCREEIIAAAADGDLEMARLIGFVDFFSLSECRDLLFHVQEHRYTLPEVESTLRELDLDFLGFTLHDQDSEARFKAMNPNPAALASLPHWHAFETRHPDTFRSLYVLWCQSQRAGA